jgi:hypothetical protein
VHTHSLLPTPGTPACCWACPTQQACWRACWAAWPPATFCSTEAGAKSGRWGHSHAHMRAHTYTCTRMRTDSHAPITGLPGAAEMRWSIHTLMHTDVHMPTSTRTHTRTCAPTRMHMHACMCPHMHAFSHPLPHTRACRSRWRSTLSGQWCGTCLPLASASSIEALVLRPRLRSLTLQLLRLRPLALHLLVRPSRATFDVQPLTLHLPERPLALYLP